MYYFVSDIHLGAGCGNERCEAREVERRFVAWLHNVGSEAQGIFLCGDVFDFWFEYQRVVPKGFVRVLGEIASLTDRGVRVVFMAGNHDMWLSNYLSEECGVEIYTSPRIFSLNGRKVHVAHGDNLNVRGDVVLQMMNSMFRSQIVRNLFSALVHPDLAIRFGQWWSNSSRGKHSHMEGQNTIDGLGVRDLLEYAAQQQRREPCDYYIYGHLHQIYSHRVEASHGAGGYEVLFMNNWSEGQTPHYVILDEEGVAEIKRVEI